MDFERVTPEQVGVSSEHIQKYISVLERAQLSTHDIIMIRHGKIFFEKYWEPFHEDYLHRMYSVTKSFVSIAIGFLEQEGRIDLDAPAISYLDPETTENAFDNVKRQTIRNMLMMTTGATAYTELWFARKPQDRLKDYFKYTSPEVGGVSKIPGAFFEYDSPGSFVLGSIVERITGMKLIDYLREKLFDKIGVSKEAYILSCPGGHSWADSALLCKPVDLARVCQFMLNKGSWNGEQILNRKYCETATDNLIDTNLVGHLTPASYGYGYQFWRCRGNSFSFNGMGAQYAVGIPQQDMVFVINSDNQGHPASDLIIIDRFFEEIVEKVSEQPLPENNEAYNALQEYTRDLRLYALPPTTISTIAEQVSGKEYVMNENPMGITKMKFVFGEKECRLDFTNAQGDKTIMFGMGENVFGMFPQEGYSKQVATVYAPGHYFKCASSARFTHENKLELLVQIIDEYFGRLYIRAAFLEDNTLAVLMQKTAEDFLQEFEGYADGTAK